jgi:hypothetical protein
MVPLVGSMSRSTTRPSVLLLLARWESLGLGTSNPVLGTFSLPRVGQLLHQPMIPRHCLAKDRSALVSVMSLRKEAGPAYRGY